MAKSHLATSLASGEIADGVPKVQIVRQRHFGRGVGDRKLLETVAHRTAGDADISDIACGLDIGSYG